MSQQAFKQKPKPRAGFNRPQRHVMPEFSTSNDKSKLQVSIDERAISALASGTLRQLMPNSSSTEVAENFFAPSLKTDWHEGEHAWVSREDAFDRLENADLSLQDWQKFRIKKIDQPDLARESWESQRLVSIAESVGPTVLENTVVTEEVRAAAA